MKYLIFLCLFFSLCGAGWFGYAHYDALERKKAAQIARIEATQTAQRNVSRLQISHITAFKDDLKKAAQAYKAAVNIMAEIVKPENFATQDYAHENYRLFNDDIEPEIRLRADVFLGVFTRYKTKLDDLVDENSSDIEKRFSQEWMEMHDVQLARTIDLLTLDDQLIAAYADLIEFYYVHSKLFDVDVENEIFDFKREEDAVRHDALLKAIRDLRRDKATKRRR